MVLGVRLKRVRSVTIPEEEELVSKFPVEMIRVVDEGLVLRSSWTVMLVL